MNREILFKAKRIDNGEWVEGCVFDDGFADSKRLFVGGLVITDYKGTADDRWDVGLDFYEVNPDTLCQYTGLTDKNGNKIWENDVVKMTYRDGFYEVGWIKYSKCSVRYHFVVDEEPFSFDFTDDMEVIGNIFDNKELLE